jgi:hypothetical protein
MTSYWLPYHCLSEQDSRVIVREFCEVFEDASMWVGSGDDWLLLGIRDGHQRVDEAKFRAQWNDGKVRPILVGSGFECPEQLGSYFVGDRDAMLELVAKTPPLVDNFPHRLSPATSIEHIESRYKILMDADACLERFQTSDHIRRIWPATLIWPSAEYFPFRGCIHDLWVKESRRVSEVPVRSLASIHWLLTESDLETAVLWSLGTGYRDQLVVDMVIEEGRTNEWVLEKLGHRYLAQRKYEKAGETYDKALIDMPQDSKQYPLAVIRRAFVFCLLGRVDLAGQVIQKRLGNVTMIEGAQRDLDFLQTKFGLPAPDAPKALQVAAQ